MHSGVCGLYAEGRRFAEEGGGGESGSLLRCRYAWVSVVIGGAMAQSLKMSLKASLFPDNSWTPGRSSFRDSLRESRASGNMMTVTLSEAMYEDCYIRVRVKAAAVVDLSQIDPTSITILNFYFYGIHKTFPLTSIVGVSAAAIPRFCIWGPRTAAEWWAWDPARRKLLIPSGCIRLKLHGECITKCFSCENVDVAIDLIRMQISGIGIS